MFFEERREVPATPEKLRAEYAVDLAAAVESVGVETAVERSGLDRSTVEAVAREDESPISGLGLREAARLQALAEGAPDADSIVEIACDNLLLGMSMGVLDVDTLARELAFERTPKELQQKLERRAPMTFEEYVAIEHVVAGRRG
jgi:hypothetical protein